MYSCILTLCVLFLLATVCESVRPVVKVEFNGTAVLPCTARCSGVVRWSMFSKPSDILAECDQTSCRSVKEGYQMIHNQYLHGDLSLIITEADYSKRAWYTCDCDGTDICDVRLQIEALKTTVNMKVGETLVLEVDVSDSVEVIYSSTDPAGPSDIQICRVDRRSVEFGSDYTKRASLTSDLELSELEESDSGVYTVRNMLTKEVTRIYTVFIHGDSGAQGQEKNTAAFGVLTWLMVLLTGVIVGMCILHNRKKFQTPEKQRPVWHGVKSYTGQKSFQFTLSFFFTRIIFPETLRFKDYLIRRHWLLCSQWTQN